MEIPPRQGIQGCGWLAGPLDRIDAARTGAGPNGHPDVRLLSARRMADSFADATTAAYSSSWYTEVPKSRVSGGPFVHRFAATCASSARAFRLASSSTNVLTRSQVFQ